MNNEKRCGICKETKLVSDFYKNKSYKDGYDYRCKACEKEKKSTPEARAKRLEYSRKRSATRVLTPEQQESFRRYHRIHARKQREKTRASIIDMYGGCCSACGESDRIVLDIDHINNDGAEHRSLKGGGGILMDDILRQGHRPDRFQLLCKNCNWRKEYARRISSRMD